MYFFNFLFLKLFSGKEKIKNKNTGKVWQDFVSSAAADIYFIIYKVLFNFVDGMSFFFFFFSYPLPLLLRTFEKGSQFSVNAGSRGTHDFKSLVASLMCK